MAIQNIYFDFEYSILEVKGPFLKVQQLIKEYKLYEEIKNGLKYQVKLGLI